VFGSSRYAGLPTGTAAVPDGAGGQRDVTYLLTRFPGDPRAMTTIAVHRVAADDRLDLIASTYLGDVAAFWRICDANRALDPAALVAPDEVGSDIAIPAPGP
jgi:hypothetical protein